MVELRGQGLVAVVGALHQEHLRDPAAQSTPVQRLQMRSAREIPYTRVIRPKTPDAHTQTHKAATFQNARALRVAFREVGRMVEAFRRCDGVGDTPVNRRLADIMQNTTTARINHLITNVFYILSEVKPSKLSRGPEGYLAQPHARSPLCWGESHVECEKLCKNSTEYELRVT